MHPVSIALDNHAAIDAVYGNNNPQDETPTGESIDAVAGQLAAFEENGPKIIILATDGEPDTCNCATSTPAGKTSSLLLTLMGGLIFGFRRISKIRTAG